MDIPASTVHDTLHHKVFNHLKLQAMIKYWNHSTIDAIKRHFKHNAIFCFSKGDKTRN